MVYFISHIVPLRAIRVRRRLSERALASAAGLSRGALRAAELGASSIRVETLAAAAAALGVRVQILGIGTEGAPDCSTIAVSLKVVADGFASWKHHFMELVDEFRRSLDARLICMPPTPELDPRLEALLAAIVAALADEVEIEAPEWARRSYFLPEPWFVAGSESLKASALIESPLPFRRNNVFVLENFLERV